MSEAVNYRNYIFEEEFLNYLADHDTLSQDILERIRNRVVEGKGSLDSLLSEYLSAQEVLACKSELLGLQSISLTGRYIGQEVIGLVPEELAGKYGIVPVSVDGSKLQVATADPIDTSALDDISIYTGYFIEPLLASKEEIRIAIRDFYTAQRSGAVRQQSDYGAAGLWKVAVDHDPDTDGPAVKLVDSLISQAISEKASDIHWEPSAKNLIVKFRIDGALIIKTALPRTMSGIIAARLKVMAGMDVTERRIPQDGRIMLDVPDKTIDIRVSTLATVYGEKIVTRILDADTAQLSLQELGMREDVEQNIRKLIQQPYGLILICGPTGSGKTTTLYALLKEVRSESLNIVSIEDPVEYRLPGVNQVQVNLKTGLDFAGGLRAILRQDPDIIMVGEIRDKDTARMAIAAALTGHLVFSTVHTNTAAEALARLLDMGIEPYLLASAVCGVIAQRLVRRLCPHCKRPQMIEAEMIRFLGWEPRSMVYGSQGCPRCQGKGYNGRIGIHEYLPYNQEIKELVLQKVSALTLEQASRASGMLSLQEDGLLKVDKGLTSLEEVIRLAAGV